MMMIVRTKDGSGYGNYIAVYVFIVSRASCVILFTWKKRFLPMLIVTNIALYLLFGAAV
jgi:hypothetical protein